MVQNVENCNKLDIPKCRVHVVAVHVYFNNGAKGTGSHNPFTSINTKCHMSVLAQKSHVTIAPPSNVDCELWISFLCSYKR